MPDWEHSDIQPKPELWDSISGMHSFVTALVLDTDMPEVEQQRLKEDYEKNPTNVGKRASENRGKCGRVLHYKR